MPKKLTPVEEIDAAVEMTEDQVILANHVLEVNGNMLHLEIKDGFMSIKNEVITGLPKINASDENLAKALSTAWLGILDGRYAEMDRWVHAYHTKTELQTMMVCDWAGFLVITEGIPYASQIIPASRFVSIPTDPGVYQYEYLMGEYKVTHKMKNTRYEASEAPWFTTQRNAYYKHLALTLMVLGHDINARYFPRTGRYIAKLEEVISIEDSNERAAVSAQNIAVSGVKRTEYRLDNFIKKEAEQGKVFQSAVRAVKLADGTLMAVKDVIGREFDRWLGSLPYGKIVVTEQNVEKFISTCVQNPKLEVTVVG